VIPLKDSFDDISKENRLFKFEAKERLKLIEDSLQICQANKYILDIGFFSLQENITNEFYNLHELLKEREN